MIINETLLAKLEKLSALKIPEGKKEKITEQLNSIVNFVEILNELDLDNTQVTVTTLNGGTPCREDIPEKKDVIDTILKFAPDSENNYFVVPKIIE